MEHEMNIFPRRHFDLEHDIFRENFVRFLKDEVVPYQRDWEAAGQVPKSIWKRCGELGFLATFVDPEFGGAGCADFRYEQIIAEELAYANEFGLAISMHSSFVAPYLAEFGSDEQKRKYLPGVVSGNCILAVAMTEPGAGSDLAGIRASATEHGDYWLLNGSKTFISNGVNSDLVVVVARTDQNDKRGLSLFLVEKGWDGFSVGKKLEKLGHHAQDTAELFFSDVKVPKENLLGKPHQGMKMLVKTLVNERLSCAASAVGSARSALDLTLAYVKERKVFDRKLIDFQNTRFELAAVKTEIEVGQVYIDRMVMEYNAGAVNDVVAASVKLWTTEMLGRISDRCLQLFGGYGYMAEYPIARLWAAARVLRIGAGSSEIMKEIVGSSL
jgi:alkylation response protein AidB-like acyl-CoA dehydrogenase